MKTDNTLEVLITTNTKTMSKKTTFSEMLKEVRTNINNNELIDENTIEWIEKHENMTNEQIEQEEATQTENLLLDIEEIKKHQKKTETEVEPMLAEAFYELMDNISWTKVEMAKILELKTVTFAYKLKNRTFTREEVISLLNGLKKGMCS